MKKEPDEMGVWDEEGETIWLPRSLYPKRSSAIVWATKQWECLFTEVRCVARHLRYEPRDDGIFSEDWWYQCEADHPDAFPAWRLESAP